MTQKRMIHRDVFECGAFTELPDRAKILYLYLCINADDDGFVDKVPALLRSQKCTVRYLEALVENGFLFRFSKDLIVIRHWKKHNAISPKNHRPTIYQKELSTLCLDRHKIYQEKTEKKPTEYTEEKTEEKTEEVTEKEVVREKADATAADGSSAEIASDPCPTTTTTQEKKAEERSGSDSGEVTFEPPTREEVEAYAKAEGLIHVDIGRFYDYYDGNGWRTSKGILVNWRFKLREWERSDAKDAEKDTQPDAGSFDTDDFFNAAVARSYGSMEA